MSKERLACMPAGIREALEKQIAGGKDNPLARLTLGRILLSEDDLDGAVAHLTRAIALDTRYSAAYATLGKALARKGDVTHAHGVYRQGIAIAEENGDLQASRQMDVMLRKLEKTMS